MSGIDRNTGLFLEAWAHTRQSVEVLLKTHIGERLMRRDFGLGVGCLLGRLLKPELFLTFKTLLAVALETFEPRLSLKRLTCQAETESIKRGHVVLRFDVVFRPRGHLGDFTASHETTFTLPLEAIL